MSLLNPDSTPQFNTAEMPGQPTTDRCKGCGQPITGSYYRVGSNLACPSCAERLKREGPQDNQAAFTRGLLLGIAGAVLGCILYSGFVIMTGISIGYLALAVGFIVAKAILIGSKGIRGKRYQISAAILTYLAVSASWVPILLSFAAKSGRTIPLETLIEWGIAAPFLRFTVNPVSGVLGALILLVGIRIAWQMTAGTNQLEIYGPYEASKSTSASTSA